MFVKKNIHIIQTNNDVSSREEKRKHQNGQDGQNGVNVLQHVTKVRYNLLPPIQKGDTRNVGDKISGNGLSPTRPGTYRFQYITTVNFLATFIQLILVYF